MGQMQFLAALLFVCTQIHAHELKHQVFDYKWAKCRESSAIRYYQDNPNDIILLEERIKNSLGIHFSRDIPFAFWEKESLDNSQQKMGLTIEEYRIVLENFLELSREKMQESIYIPYGDHTLKVIVVRQKYKFLRKWSVSIHPRKNYLIIGNESIHKLFKYIQKRPLQYPSFQHASKSKKPYRKIIRKIQKTINSLLSKNPETTIFINDYLVCGNIHKDIPDLKKYLKYNLNHLDAPKLLKGIKAVEKSIGEGNFYRSFYIQERSFISTLKKISTQISPFKKHRYSNKINI